MTVLTLISRAIRDMLLMGVGVIAFIVTPPSVEDAGIYGPLSIVWALMIGLGATVSFLGVLLRLRRWEIAGCMFVGGGFAVWAFAICALPHLSLTVFSVALAFLAITAGQFFRVGMIAERAHRDVR